MAVLTFQSICIGISGILLSILVPKIVYYRFISPLRKIPGPWLASITDQWSLFVFMAGNRTTTLHKLHQKYGPVVRVGPSELSFTSPEIVQELYGPQTKFIKAPWYDGMSAKPVGIFAERDRTKHHHRRKLLGPAFTQAALNDIEPSIDELIQNLVGRIAKSFGKPQNMLVSFRLLSLDVVGALFLGQSFRALETDEPHSFLTWMDYNFIDLSLLASFPITHALLVILPFSATKALTTATDKIKEYGREKFDEYIQKNGRTPRRRDLLTRILNTEAETGEKTLPDFETSSEIGNMIFAGTDTTSTTLTYLFWELAKHQDWQDKLRDELSTHFVSHTNPSYSDLTQLPILDAIINESLRLHPAAPCSLPRETPVGGRMLDGVFVPEGTIVSMQCWTTHRDPIAFPQPEKWGPDRWITPSKDADHNRAKELYMPFSKGPRNCLGKNIAIMELKKTTAALIMQTRVHVAPSTKDEDMEIIDHFLALPKGGKCELVFEKL